MFYALSITEEIELDTILVKYYICVLRMYCTLSLVTTYCDSVFYWIVISESEFSENNILSYFKCKGV